MVFLARSQLMIPASLIFFGKPATLTITIHSPPAWPTSPPGRQVGSRERVLRNTTAATVFFLSCTARLALSTVSQPMHAGCSSARGFLEVTTGWPGLDRGRHAIRAAPSPQIKSYTPTRISIPCQPPQSNWHDVVVSAVYGPPNSEVAPLGYTVVGEDSGPTASVGASACRITYPTSEPCTWGRAVRGRGEVARGLEWACFLLAQETE